MDKHEIGIFSQLAMTAACIFGVACAAVGGTPGLFAGIWIGVTLIIAWCRMMPKFGTLTLGLAVVYGLASLAGFGGTDPEDVDTHLSLRLAAVAIGCAVVGVTSVLVWIANSFRRDGSSAGIS